VIIAYVVHMLRKLTFALVLGLLGGCGVGGGDGGQTTPDAGGGSGSGSGPGSDDTPKADCSAELTVTGTFTAAAALDPLGGCQPAGTWELTAAVSSQGNCASVPVKVSYTYTLTGVGRDTQLTYSTSSGEEFHGAVNATGSGGCQGSFEHITAETGKFGQLLLKPLLPAPTAGGTTLAITGVGHYDLWPMHP